MKTVAFLSPCVWVELAHFSAKEHSYIFKGIEVISGFVYMPKKEQIWHRRLGCRGGEAEFIFMVCNLYFDHFCEQLSHPTAIIIAQTTSVVVMKKLRRYVHLSVQWFIHQLVHQSLLLHSSGQAQEVPLSQKKVCLYII